VGCGAFAETGGRLRLAAKFAEVAECISIESPARFGATSLASFEENGIGLPDSIGLIYFPLDALPFPEPLVDDCVEKAGAAAGAGLASAADRFAELADFLHSTRCTPLAFWMFPGSVAFSDIGRMLLIT
jgi:hypothetical protein